VYETTVTTPEDKFCQPVSAILQVPEEDVLYARLVAITCAVASVVRMYAHASIVKSAEKLNALLEGVVIAFMVFKKARELPPNFDCAEEGPAAPTAVSVFGLTELSTSASPCSERTVSAPLFASGNAAVGGVKSAV
jgi:hypothetical protein